MTPPAHRHVLIGGRPRLLLGGQLHNSTSSDLDRARAAFDRVVAMGGNAVTATVSCRVELSDLGLVFLPGATTVTASSTAPVDTWRGTR